MFIFAIPEYMRVIYFFIHYSKTKLIAITIIPATIPYIERWCSPYSLADGSNSSKDINTIIPAIIANRTPYIFSLRNGIKIK